MAKKKHDFNLTQPANAWFIIGSQENNGDYRMVDDLRSLNVTILRKSHTNLNTSLNVINNMDHDTIFPAALTLGLMKIYNLFVLELGQNHNKKRYFVSLLFFVSF